MNFVKNIVMRAFGRPRGLLGKPGGIIMARMNQPVAQRAVALLDVRPSDKVLEIGFGPGVGIRLLARFVSSGWVAGIDPSREMLEQARTRNATDLKTGKVELQRGSVERLPFENATFDKALAINSMQLWPDAIAGLREIRRVLDSEGRIVLGFTRHSGQAKAGLAAAFRSAGFTNVRIMEGKGNCVCLRQIPAGAFNRA